MYSTKFGFFGGFSPLEIAARCIPNDHILIYGRGGKFHEIKWRIVESRPNGCTNSTNWLPVFYRGFYQSPISLSHYSPTFRYRVIDNDAPPVIFDRTCLHPARMLCMIGYTDGVWKILYRLEL